jgi:signal transduction histidine kinase
MGNRLRAGSPAAPRALAGLNDPIEELVERARAACESLATHSPFLSPETGRSSRTAPELTGRTGHPVDHRAELYALGAACYEWACGHPCFDESDPLQLLHDQLATTPQPLHELRPDIPRVFCDIVHRLLEKDPARRYQSADGLLHDLDRLLGALRRGEDSRFTLGERDFPLRFTSSRIVGREPELARLQAAIDAAAAGEFRVLFIGGDSGVGKTALVSDLRPRAALAGGHFVACRGARRETDPSALEQALRALGGLLLAESEAGLAADRARIAAALGANAHFITAVPEFRLLLGGVECEVAADAAEPDTANVSARATSAMLELLRAVASPARPLVLVLDDLQWSGEAALQLIDAALDDGKLRGLVIAGTFREPSTGARNQAFRAALARWIARPHPPEVLRLGNLNETDLALMLKDMLRLDENLSREFAAAVEPHTAGHPYDTIEFANALRDDGLLTWHNGKWHWDAAALRRPSSAGRVTDLQAVRIARLPSQALALLQMLACIRQEISVEAASLLCGRAADEIEPYARLLVEEGFATRVAGPPAALRLRHDRVQEAAWATMPADRQAHLQLEIARRAAAVPGMGALAAGQFAAAWHLVADAREASTAAGLMRDAAAQARITANFQASRRLLEDALGLLDRFGPNPSQSRLRLECEIALHLSLCGAGAFDAADAVYARIAERADPHALAAATCAQVDSLAFRLRMTDAAETGTNVLRSLGMQVPARLELGELTPRFLKLRAWVEAFDLEAERSRPAAGDDVASIARLIWRLVTPSVSVGIELTCWLLLEAYDLWMRHGPSATLATVLASGGLVGPGIRDRRTPYLCARNMLALCDARGWKAESSPGRCVYAFSSVHWFEPIEQAMRQALMAREGMSATGDVLGVSFTHRIAVDLALDCEPTLAGFARVLDAFLAGARSACNAYDTSYATVTVQLLEALRAPGGTGAFEFGGFSEERFLRDHAADPDVCVHVHLRGCVAAAIFGDMPRLWRHVHACATHHRYTGGAYVSATVRWLGAVGAACEPRAPGAAPSPFLERALQWLEARAADSPANFQHMLLHAKAESAWSAGDEADAARLFDDALAAVDKVCRPWHRAFITERAARLHLSRGRGTVGHALLSEADRLWREWGATAKADALRTELGTRGGTAPVTLPGSHQEIDSIALLRAAQALGAERDPAGLRARVEEILLRITGAARVILAEREDDSGTWFIPGPSGARVPAEEAGHLVPLSALRYVERTREPLVVADPRADDRFAADGYWKDAPQCSLMAVPVLNHGAIRAMVLLESRAMRRAFGSAHIDAVHVIAGQLAVSLENALLYESLERKVSQQTAQLREAHSRLLSEARRAGMAQVATNVLHNVGNVLTSVNVSARLLGERIRESRIGRVREVARLLRSDVLPTGGSPEAQDRARRLPAYVEELGAVLEKERDEMLRELTRLAASIEHIKNVVATQQAYAGYLRVIENARAAQMVEDALFLKRDALAALGIRVQRHFDDTPAVPLDKARVMQVLVNLIDNALDAMRSRTGGRTLRVSVRGDPQGVRIEVSDNGCGIAKADLPSIFSHGFTTKAGGHGFGLHSCAMAAREMGGSLTVHSDGPGAGATFTLWLPAQAGTAD